MNTICKRTFMPILIVFLFFLVHGTSSFVYAKSINETNPVHANNYTIIGAKENTRVFDGKIVAYLSSGDGTEEVGYLDDEPCNIAPNAFIVEDNQFHILDTAKNRIITINGEKTEAFSISPCVYPKHFCANSEYFFITDKDMTDLFIFTKSGDFSSKISLPAEAKEIGVYKISSIENNTVKIILSDYKSYSLSAKSIASSSDYKWTEDNPVEMKISDKDYFSIDFGPNTMVQCIGKTDNGLVVDLYEFVPKVPIILFEETIRVVNKNGDTISCAIIDNLNTYYNPDDNIYLTPSGTIYVMYCYEDGVYIVCPNMYSDKKTNINELEEYAHSVMDDLISQSSRENHPITTRTRYQVQTYANNCAGYNWTFIYNKNATIRTIVENGQTYTLTLPGYEQTAVNNNENITVEGIPYCRGGHDSPSTFHSKLDTLYGGNYYTAGNITKKTIPGSTGLDCSGFACYAYNAPSQYYWTTASFAADGAGYYAVQGSIGNSTISGYYSGNVFHCTNDFSNMKKMDYIVKADNHIVLYREFYDTTKVKIIHASRTQDSKVISTNYSFKDLIGFLMKSPYSCAEDGCSYTWEHTSTQHRKTCSVCGIHTGWNAHTWLAYGNGYRCKYCLYIVNQLPANSLYISAAS